MVDNSVDAPALYGPYAIDNQTLFDLTKKTAEEKSLKFDYKDYGDLGYLVTQIGEQKNGTDNKFWQYWVNNEQVQVSADKYTVKPGDVIMWKFVKSAF